MTQTNSERLERLHTFLTQEKMRLWNELRVELFETLGKGLHSQYDIPQDVGEKGIIDLLEDTGLAVADIHKEELSRIEEALRRLANGSYGFCEDCGEPIDEGRLRVAPFAPCCVDCQERREEHSSTKGLTL